MPDTLISRGRHRVVEAFGKWLPWYRLPKWLALANLSQVRDTLRSENLYDTRALNGAEGPAAEAPGAAASSSGSSPAAGNGAPSSDPPGQVSASFCPVSNLLLRFRTADGSYNDLEGPLMGAKGQRFGRNVPLEAVARPGPTALLTPSPRLVSERLLARQQFVPATSLNVLACAWIQFMTRDWFSHGENPPADPYEVPIAGQDKWPEQPMKVPRTRPDPSRCPVQHGPPTFTNDVTHWWDASQIYGSDEASQRKLRSGQGGKLRLDSAQRLLVDPETGADLTGFITDTNWAPLALLHTLFAREHNAICDALAAHYPSWGDDELFGHARLVNAALLAKIHTVEWTPALLPNPTLVTALHTNWWGILGEKARNRLGRVIDDELLSGIPGGAKNHFGVPYAITEEFVAVYRMHSLVPDEFSFRSLSTDEELRRVELPDLLGERGRKLIDELGVESTLYSLGVSHPGALRLHNYPNHLRRLKRHDGTLMDLATVDVLRDRERGVPRYNAFRELLHLPKAKSFEALTDNPAWAAELKEVYGDVDLVDLLPGVLAEPLPEGMAFGDTAFRIFILMASRRLNSDRFFTTDFTPEIYSPVGMDWIRDNDMSDVLLRHYPSLAPALSHVENAFSPWNSVTI